MSPMWRKSAKQVVIIPLEGPFYTPNMYEMYALTYTLSYNVHFMVRVMYALRYV